MNEQTGEQPVADSPTLEEKVTDLLFGHDDDQAQEAQSDDQAEEGTDEGEQAEAPAEALEEVEWNGKKFTAPKDVKEALEKSRGQEADYTRKSQDVADEKRIITAAKEEIKLRAAFEKICGDEISKLSAINAQLAEAKNIDWSNLDTDTMIRTRAAIDKVKDQQQELQGSLRLKYEALQGKVAEYRSQQMQAADQYLQRHVPKWSNETAREVAEYVASEGVTAAEMDAFDNPKLISIAWKARQWDALQKSKPSALEKTGQAPPLLKPGASDPQMSAKMQNLNFRRQIKQARTSQEKARLIQNRIANSF